VNPNQAKPRPKQNQPNNRNNKRPAWKRFISKRPIKRAVRELTAGGVVFRRGEKNQLEFLMIQDAKNRWTVPKGHVESGERIETTAAREVTEETGLKHIKVLDHLGKTNFRYRREDNLILMTQHMFLMEATSGSDQLKKEEWMNGIGWFSVNDALDLIEYEDISKLFLLALKKIRDRNR
jgi:ADP-ribose pyrophosphatase YjhB (NUDIX family)